MADIYLYGGAANLTDIILRDPSHAAVTAVGSVGGGGKPTKRWFELLQEEYAEQYRQEHPELKPTKDKKAVKARKEVDRLIGEAAAQGLFEPYTAPELAELVVKTKTAPNVADALKFADHIKAYLKRRLDEKEEEEIEILLLSLT
jgi:hypothetical protein